MIHVAMIVQNEADRHLETALECAILVTAANGGKILVTDDASEDDTVGLCQDSDAFVQTSDRPLFWEHEGRARQRHYDFVASFCEPGDWILSLDADESLNRPDLVGGIVAETEAIERDDWRGRPVGAVAIGLPLYEFWTPTAYRTDGFWFGTRSTRLFKFLPGGQIAQREMGCGSEPTYVADAVRRGCWHLQDKLHLLHWGYVRPEDRVRKHALYTERLGGHGHNDAHIASIIAEPTLVEYRGWSL